MNFIRTLFITGIFCSTVLAQDRASITGTVTDSSGASMAGATVTLLMPATQLQREARTNSSGIYSFTSLAVGSYQVTISSDHFRPIIVDQIELSYAQVRTVDAKLQVGTATEQVEVAASTDALNRTTAEQGIVIESPQIADTPLNGRNWATLMTLAPGRLTPVAASSVTFASTVTRSMTATLPSTGLTSAVCRNKRKRLIRG